MSEQGEEIDPFDSIPNFIDKKEQITFSDEQLADFSKCFSKIDKAGSGLLEITEIGSLIRASGLNPSLKLINEILSWLQEKKIEQITVENFHKILEKVWEQSDADELRDALRIFDSDGSGYFTLEQLKKFLFAYGEKLDEDEFKDLAKSITIQSDGTINHGNYYNFMKNN